MKPEPHNMDAFQELLEEERRILLRGDLEALAALLPKKESLVETLLETSGWDRDMIGPVEEKLKRNQLLLDGALDGIRAVAARLAALRQVRSALDTYDARGRRQSVKTPVKNHLEKRA